MTLSVMWNFVDFIRTFLDTHERVGKEFWRPLILTMSLQLCYVLIFSIIFLIKHIITDYGIDFLSFTVCTRQVADFWSQNICHFLWWVTIEVFFFFFLRCNWKFNTFFHKRVSQYSIYFYLLWKARLKSGGK